MKGCAVLSQAAALGWSCGGKVSCAMGPGEHSQGVTLAAGVRRDTPPQQPLVPLWHPLSLSPKLCLVGTPLNGWGLQEGAWQQLTQCQSVRRGFSMAMWHRSVGLSQHMNITAGALHALPCLPAASCRAIRGSKAHRRLC